jgi:hypothetical protein
VLSFVEARAADAAVQLAAFDRLRTAVERVDGLEKARTAAHGS